MRRAGLTGVLLPSPEGFTGAFGGLEEPSRRGTRGPVRGYGAAGSPAPYLLAPGTPMGPGDENVSGAHRLTAYK